MIVKALVTEGLPIMCFGFGVFLPQPSSDAFPELLLHFTEHSRAVGVMKVADPSPRPAIHAGDVRAVTASLVADEGREGDNPEHATEA